MRSLSFRTALIAFSLVLGSIRVHGQTSTPPPPATPAPVAAPLSVESQDTAEAKLAVVLRSYTLLRDENDQLRAAQEKLLAEKSSLEAQLAVAKTSMPLADQATALHEQLRQTQDQLAALSTENNQLKTRLALGAPSQGSVMVSPTRPDATPAPAASAPEVPPPAIPAARTHVVVAGDTLMKISKKYYGTPDRWTSIFAANPDILKDEKSLIIGCTLRIP